MNTGAALGGFQEAPSHISLLEPTHPILVKWLGNLYLKVKLMPLHFATVWTREAGVGHYRLLGGISLVTCTNRSLPTHVHAQWESNGIFDLTAVK